MPITNDAPEAIQTAKDVRTPDDRHSFDAAIVEVIDLRKLVLHRIELADRGPVVSQADAERRMANWSGK